MQIEGIQVARCNWLAVALFCGAAACAGCMATCGLWFAPGWANEWPGGLSIHLVWPVGLTTLAATILMTAAVGAGAGLAAGYQHLTGRPPGRWAVRLWLAVALLATIAVSVYLFTQLRADALAMWPH